MTKRRQSEIAFGSDAFLDVIANIVGILIILIVVAGVKVGRAPIPAQQPVTADIAQQEPQPTPADPVRLPEVNSLEPVAEVHLEPEPPPVTALPEPLPQPDLSAHFPTEIVPGWASAGDPPQPMLRETIPEELPPLPTLVPSEPPPELYSEYINLQAELSELKVRLSTVSTEVQLEEKSTVDLTRSLETLKTQTEEAVRGLSQKQTELAQAQSLVQEHRQRMSRLSEALLAGRQVKPPVKSLEHRLTPVSQNVEGLEIHFRLEGDRVSYVPVTELATLVRADMERHKEILLTRSFYKGSVGPRAGYRMEYLVQREAKTFAEGFRESAGVVRILVTQWIILPEKSLETETAEEALQAESHFAQSLRQSRGNVTITFWVYPDSFGLHQTLKQAIHEAGRSVASRPLPTGVPIAGSPDGTKSISQ